MRKVSLFGLDYTAGSQQEIIEHCLQTDTSKTVVTPNIDHIVRIHSSEIIKAYYESANVCLNDSRVLTLLCKLLGIESPPTTTGSDLIKSLFDSKKLSKKRLFFLGLETEYFDALKSRYCFLKDCELIHVNPPMGFYQDRNSLNEVIEKIAQFNGDFVFLAVGSPQQESIAYSLNKKLKRGTVFCIGASLDYLSSKEKRAPKWVQDAYMEWLFRFFESPRKRFKRYFLNCPRIFLILLKVRFLS